MAKFTTRIELRNATPKEYDLLDKAMLKEGFTKTLVSEDGSVFILPSGEYNKDVAATIKEVYKMAEYAANSTGLKNWILTSESINRMWKLQEIIE